MVGDLTADYARRLKSTEQLLAAKVDVRLTPKLTRVEIDARLASPKALAIAAHDGQHAVRVAADLAARKARREGASAPSNTDGAEV